MICLAIRKYSCGKSPDLTKKSLAAGHIPGFQTDSKGKIAKVVARFLPRPEEVDEDFDDVVEANVPICNQIEAYTKRHNIALEKGWKVRLAATIKREILKGNDKVIAETDPEFTKIVELFSRF